jgi:hypothetical protein
MLRTWDERTSLFDLEKTCCVRQCCFGNREAHQARKVLLWVQAHQARKVLLWVQAHQARKVLLWVQEVVSSWILNCVFCMTLIAWP